MAALDFTDRAAVLEYLTAQLPNADTGVIEALLDASAGTNCATPPVTTYRPYFVEARLRLTGRSGELKSARGASGAAVEYRDTAGSVYRNLMRDQALLDANLCSVPPGYEASGGNRARVMF